MSTTTAMAGVAKGKQAIRAALRFATLVAVALVAPGAARATLPSLTTGKTAVATSTCQQAQITLQVNGVGDPVTQRLPIDLMLVMDRSGSMDDAGGNPVQPITDAKNAAMTLVNQLDVSNDRAGLTSFATTATLDRALTNDFTSVNSAIGALSVSGNTNIGAGVKTGQQELGTHGRAAPAVRVMVVLTDGVANRTAAGGSCTNVPTSSNACTQDAVNQAATAKAAGTVVFTIGLNLNNLGGATATLARNTLKAMASNAGDYFEAPTSAQLAGIFSQIGSVITNIAGSNIVVTDILPSGVQYVSGSASPGPTSVVGQTLTWNLGLLDIGNSTSVTFLVSLNPATPNQLVDVYPDSRIDYSDYQGSPATAPFPETHVTTSVCPTATPVATNTATATATSSVTPSSTATVSPTATVTPDATATASETGTVTLTPTATNTPPPTATATDTPTQTALPTPYCGDGHIDPGESCDDGNQIPGDGCEPDCTVTPACVLFYPGVERFVGACGSPTFADIQSAIDASADGDIVTVCPGSYAQSVVVTQQVKIQAAGGGGATVHTAGTAFDVRRSAVQIEGLTIQADSGSAIAADNICPIGQPSCGSPGTGSHLVITNNTIQNSPIGIGWHREVDCAQITSNTMTNNATHIALLQQDGQPAVMVGITANTITGGGQNGAAVSLSGLGGLNVAANTIQNSTGAGIVLASLTGGGATQVIENSIDSNTGDGITVQPGADGVVIQHNNITHNGTGLGNEANSGALDATLNWWASQTGPSGLFTGHGDSIVNRSSGTTVFIEFLCAPFPQGFASTLGVCSTETAELRQLLRGQSPDFDPLGRYIAFESNDNLDVDQRTSVSNADGSAEVFLINRRRKKKLTGVCLGGMNGCDFTNAQACATCTDSKDCPGDPNSDPLVLDGECVLVTQLSDGVAPQTSSKPRVTARFKSVVYVTTNDELGLNPDGSSEIINFNGQSFTKGETPYMSMVSNGASPAVVFDNPAPSLNARLIVVESNANPTGGNPDGNYEIFVFDNKTKQWQQLTDTQPPVDNHRPATVDGKRIVFDSNGDLVPGKNTDGNRELFMAHIRGSGVDFTQITDTVFPVDNRSGSLDGHAVAVAFSSNGDFLPGGNPDGNSEIFVWQRRTGVFEQLTNSPNGENANPTINLGARFVVFESNADLTGSGATNRRIFQFDRFKQQLTLLSQSRFGSNQLARIGQRRFVIWESTANLTGHNPSGDSVIYLFDRKLD